MNYGYRIKDLRKRNGLNQTELANKIGVTCATISKYENDDISIPAEIISKLAITLGTTANYLLGFDDKDNFSSDISFKKIPVYKSIPAGIPMEMIEDIVDEEEIFIKDTSKNYFGVVVNGDSMENTYHNKDIIIVEKTETCESGQDCIISINGDNATFKRVVKLKDGIILRPLNPKYEIKFYNNEEIETLPVKILGVVVEIRRKV